MLEVSFEDACLMKNFLEKILPKKEDSEFLVIEAGLERITAASFKVVPSAEISIPKLLGVGKKDNFNEENFAATTTEALKTLEAIVTKLPKKVLLGVSGSGAKTATVVAKVTRAEPNKAVTEEEMEEILTRSAGSQDPLGEVEKKDYKLFFSTVVWANIDGAKIINPVGSHGTEMEVSCFHAYKKTVDLENWDRYLVDSSFEIGKVIPTAYALSKIIIKNGIQSLILIRISDNKTEVSFITEANIAEVASFDIGFKQMEVWPQAISILFAEVSLPRGLPDVIWIYPEGAEEMGEKVRTALSEINWKQDFKREIPNIKIGQKPEGFTVEDTPLIALGMEGVSSGLA